MPAIVAPKATPDLDVAIVKSQLAAIEESTGLGESLKAAVVAKYTEAIDLLKLAEENATQTAGFREVLRSAPAEREQLGQSLKELPAVEELPKRSNDQTTQALTKELELLRAELVEIHGELDAVERLRAILNERPVEIGARLPEARQELSVAESALASWKQSAGPKPTEAANLVLLQAQREVLESEVEMLTQGRSSLGVRGELAEMRLALLKGKERNSRAAIEALQKFLENQRQSDVDLLADRLAQITTELGDDEELQAMSAELQGLSKELQESTVQLRKANKTRDRVAGKLTSLKEVFQRIEKQFAIGHLEGGISQMIVEQRRRLPNPKTFSYSIKARSEKLRRVRSAEFQVDELFLQLSSHDKAYDGHPSPKMEGLLALRRDLLMELQENYEALVFVLTAIDEKERSYRNKIIEVRTVLNREIFWCRSSRSADFASFKDIPAALGWFLAPENWMSGWKALSGALGRRPVLSSFIGLIVVVLLAGRRRIIADIVLTGTRIRRISTDHYQHTVRALLGTILLALPFALAIGYLAWGLDREPGTLDWVRGMTRGLWVTSLVIGCMWFLGAAYRKNGLGIVHFGWEGAHSSRFLRLLVLLVLAHLPVLFPVASTIYDQTATHFDSLGRFGLILSLFLTALLFGSFFRPSDGIFAGVIRENPERLVSRLRYVWYPLILLIPLSITILAWNGWVIAALALDFVFLGTQGIMATGYILYCMALRWFMIKERRLALEMNLEERRARRAAAEHPEEETDESIVADEAERELDLDAVGAQTRRLLRSLSGISMTVAVWFLWSRTLPLDEFLGQTSFLGINFLAAAKGMLVVAVISTLTRNLPGLLELSGLRTVVKDAGTRYAIASLGQYALVAVGAMMLSGVFQIDWTKFGWMAAALSVGLGFGLQEVVANFVCGIILLFERPIRVGDVVTVNDIDGTVTRIRMRATTITNWDRKEFLVPNKQFITGTLMNWTLSNPINRAVILVGVAYGSDTRRAREILLKVAADHPLVMDDPGPVATFEEFAASSLNLRLRVYLPNMDNRIIVITDLHTVIDERFEEAGIEIAFPQQDLHLRSSEAVIKVEQA